MKSETKKCQNCREDFVIQSEDFDFYKRIDVPAPTWCPDCRLIRRLASRENRSLYPSMCQRCQKKEVSIFRPDFGVTVYCNDCWWEDSWGAMDYATDYDFKKSFFEQFYELLKKVPHETTEQRNSENCLYSNGSIRCKNCKLCFDCYESINCYNCFAATLSRDSMDSDLVMNGDHTYETVNSNGVYNTKFVYFSDECLDSSFLFNCVGCNHCFGCVNLRNQKYHIFNKKYSKREYQREMKKWDLGSYRIREEAKKKFLELYYKTPRRFALIFNSTNVTGDDIQHSKNCQNCHTTRNGVENSKNIFAAGLLLKDSHDVVMGGGKSELFYETSGGMNSQNIYFTRAASNSKDVEYSYRLFDCSNCFGCVLLRNKEYCILNKQYSKEEYFKALKKIKKQMGEEPYVDRKGRVYKYGEFFPPELSLWAYNESAAHRYFPIHKKEALEQGFNWQDDPKRKYRITLASKNIPDNIEEVNDEIIEEVIECAHRGQNCNQQCTEVFKILTDELNFYRQMNLALPRLCPNCRDFERKKYLNPPRMWERQCQCQGSKSVGGKYQNTRTHQHGDKPCTQKFLTSVASKRKEMVYCEDCYQAEFVS